ncbi:unnamed protein product [Arabidopsis thaliana]|uniref:(thale cress) hypothetical protein n=1 Tax=Arabidopsis thaliana TaxID=3702 RepID=A0A7G2E5Q8_ARATH|nr:unnamed protein product [Arabidopsis thaliana]
MASNFSNEANFPPCGLRFVRVARSKHLAHFRDNVCRVESFDFDGLSRCFGFLLLFDLYLSPNRDMSLVNSIYCSVTECISAPTKSSM